MFQKVKPLFMSAVTPMHVGSGSELGLVDLPIQREKHTDYPKIEGSSLKGALREALETQQRVQVEVEGFGALEKQDIEHLFGPEDIVGADDGYAGAMGFSDARLLLFPVKSMQGVFAWITSPSLLRRFGGDLQLTDPESEIRDLLEDLEKVLQEAEEKGNLVTDKSDLIIKDDKMVLEEFAMPAAKSERASSLAEKLAQYGLQQQDGYQGGLLGKRLAVVDDDTLRDFVTLSTEVVTRTKINNETGTVAQGALFTEELMPAESLFYSMIMAGPVFQPKDKKGRLGHGDDEAGQVMDLFAKALPKVVQIGGDATLGKGVVRTRL